jgi:nicotinamidase-related amidase
MKKETCLLLIDIQADYFPGGKMELVNPEAAAFNAAELLSYFRKNHMPVIHIRNEAVHEGATFLVKGTSGTDIWSSVIPKDDETIITKNFPNSFRNTNLKETLEKLKISSLVICGMMTQNCVSSTVRAAWDYGYSMTLIWDACATRAFDSPSGFRVSDENMHHAHIAALSRFADVRNTAEVTTD